MIIITMLLIRIEDAVRNFLSLKMAEGLTGAGQPQPDTLIYTYGWTSAILQNALDLVKAAGAGFSNKQHMNKPVFFLS